jgi:Uncharacterized protein conserved in bacteria
LSKTTAIPSDIAAKGKFPDIENRVAEAFKLYHQGRLAEASQELEITAEIIPKEPPTWSAAILYSMLAFFQDKSGNIARATLTYKVVEDLLVGLKGTTLESDQMAIKFVQFNQQLNGQDGLQFLEKLLPIASKSQGKAGEALITTSLANVYLNLNNFQEAYNRGKEALKLARDVEQWPLEDSAMMTVSGSLIGLGRAQEAVDLLQGIFPKAQKDSIQKIEILEQLAVAYAALGQENLAVQSMQEASTLTASSEESFILAKLHMKFGLAYLFLKKPQETVKEFMVALSIYEKLNDEMNVAFVEGGIAQVSFESGTFEEANRHASHSADTYHKLGNQAEEARKLRIAGKSLAELNKVDDALTILTKTAYIQVDIKDREGALETFWILLDLLKKEGDFEEVKRALLTGLDTYTKVFGDKEGEVKIRRELANIYTELSQFSDALKEFDKVLGLCMELSDTKGEINVLLSMGLIYSNLKDYENWITVLTLAEKLSLNLNDPYCQLLVIGQSAAFYTSIGNNVEALQRFLEALKIAHSISKPVESEQLGIVGWFYLNMGNYAKALDYFEKGLAIARETHNQIGQKNHFMGMGYVYFAIKKYDEVLRVSREALEIVRVLKAKSDEARALELIGLALMNQKNYAAANTIFQESLELASKSQSPAHIARAYNRLGSLHFGMGKYAEAIEALKKAIEKIEFLRGQNYEQQMGFFARETLPYDSIIDALYNLYISDSIKNNGVAEEAFLFTEQGKAHVWETQLRLTRFMPIIENIPVDIRNEAGSLMQQNLIANKNYAHVSSRSGIPEEEFKQKERAWKIADENWKDFIARVQKQYPEFAFILSGRSLHLDELAIRNGEVLIEYKITPGGVYAFVLKKIGTENEIVKFTQLPIKTNDITKLVVKFLRPLQKVKNKQQDPNCAFELFKAIIQPLHKDIGSSRHLIIVPDGILTLVPFEALVSKIVVSQGLHTTHLLGDQFQISYYPSATILTINRQAIPQSLPQAGALLAVGDPVYGPDDERLDSSQISKLREIEQRKGFEFSGKIRKGAQEQGYSFERLKYSGFEVLKVSEAFRNKPGPQNILVGLKASEGRVKEKDLTQYRYVHFAVHGILAYDVPYIKEPALVLATDPDGKEDGFLTLSEIYRLKLNADLVTLSACKSGLGVMFPGEGLIGLSRAFITVGARAVFVSLWEVADESTALLMEEFYRLLAQGVDKAQALEEAKQKIRWMGYENPYFWAAFILIGN